VTLKAVGLWLLLLGIFCTTLGLVIVNLESRGLSGDVFQAHGAALLLLGLTSATLGVVFLLIAVFFEIAFWLFERRHSRN